MKMFLQVTVVLAAKPQLVSLLAPSFQFKFQDGDTTIRCVSHIPRQVLQYTVYTVLTWRDGAGAGAC